MKTILSFATIGICAFICCDAFMTLEDFKKNIQPLCTGRMSMDNSGELPNGQELPIPNTIESFIALVQKLEVFHPEWKPIELIKILLFNFRYDDADVKGKSLKNRGEVKEYYEVLLKLFRNPSMGQKIKDEDLSRDERCSLYHMISHTVNDTFRQNEDEYLESSGNVAPKYLREQGVVALSKQTLHAFALGKVLLGLLAGLERNEIASASQIYQEMRSSPNAPAILDNVAVSVLYGVTFGDIFSLTKLQIEKLEKLRQPINKESLFYFNGRWDAEVCPLHYYVDNDNLFPRHATYSLIRGATDGYMLGKNIKDIMTSNPKLSLSQILRMYYNDGFPTNRGLSWCSRAQLFNPIDFKEEALNFDKLISSLKDTSIDVDEDLKNINFIFSIIKDEEHPIFNEFLNEGNKCQRIEAVTCETPMNLLAIVDWRGSQENRFIQSEIIGNLSSGMTFTGPGTSAVSVFTNLKPSGSSFDTALNSSFTSGCGGCATKYYKPLRGSYETEVEIIRDLNETLNKLAEESEEKAGVSSKVVLYFNYGTTNRDWTLDNVLNDLRWRHRGAKIIAVGSRRDVLKIFAHDSDIETDLNNPSKLLKLKEKVCKVPAQFQYPNCYRRDDSERSERFEGVISPRGSQYWMMEPKYFLKSFKIKLIFKAINGEIRVCFSRDYYKMFNDKEPSGADCHKLNSGEEWTFQVSNPCYRYNVGSCPPFYFYIEARTVEREIESCQDNLCLTSDQIMYEFRHTGISCNGASFLTIGKFWFFSVLGLVMWAFRSE